MLNEIFTATEAAQLWGLSESAIRKAIFDKRLKEGVDYRKAGRVVLVTKQVIERLYGPMPEK